MSPGWPCEGPQAKGGRAVEGFGRGRITDILVLMGFAEGSVVEGADSHLDQGTELDFQCPEPGQSASETILAESLSTQG